MNLEHLRTRAALLDRVRSFLRGRGMLEVETPLLLSEVIPELHIEPFLAGPAAVSADTGPRAYLQASPELAMKLLLCGGSGPIFQVTRSFRAGELGALHNPEFTMVEWYRPGDDMPAGMELLDELVQHAAQAPPCVRTTYREAFQRSLGIDPHTASPAELLATARKQSVAIPADLGDDRDELLNVLLAAVIEPSLGRETPEILYHYPASQSALATTVVDDRGAEVAERFELYWRGVELANGYHELVDARLLRERLTAANSLRAADGRAAPPLPESLLRAMESPGLPPSAGVALGFDRLAMLVAGATRIDEVMATEWSLQLSGHGRLS